MMVEVIVSLVFPIMLSLIERVSAKKQLSQGFLVVKVNSGKNKSY
jgi:hypothetical protein